jgi:DNA-binding beta-propeller fold protein YncE
MRVLTCIALCVVCTTISCSAPPDHAAVAGVVAGAPGDVPRFEYDPSWPKLPLPNEWIFGEVGGVGVDARDHVWVIQRPWTVIDRELGALTGETTCCRPAPPVIEFDQDGTVVQAWPALREFTAKPGTPAGQGVAVGPAGATLWEASPGPYGEWGRREHTVYVDHRDHVWVSNDDSHVIYKFTREGRHLLTIGEHGRTAGSNDTRLLGRPAGLVIDPAANELFVADGYTNKRVIVFDADTGAYRRHWGAYGKRPSDEDLGPFDPAAPPASQFRGPVHGVALARDGLLYVTDRGGNRLQVFRPDGTFVKEAFVAPKTTDLGSAYGVALSPDPAQRWVYVNDGSNNRVWILDRASLEVKGSFASYGRSGGQVLSAHSIAVDGQGNVYIGETRGRRVQRFRLIAGR